MSSHDKKVIASLNIVHDRKTKAAAYTVKSFMKVPFPCLWAKPLWLHYFLEALKSVTLEGIQIDIIKNNVFK